MGEVISLDEYRAHKARVEADPLWEDETWVPEAGTVEDHLVRQLSSDPEFDFRPVGSIEELKQEVKRWRIATGLDKEES